MQRTLIVETSTGRLQGFINPDHGQSCFFGIPYAEAPVDGLRFKPTVKKIPWNSVFDATTFGHSGPQVFDTTEGSYEEFTGLKENVDDKAWVGSEDNLTLNIWTPSADQEKRAVIVWIHGGANWLESSRLATYHGDRFVERGDVVFVSLNYRLGVFGWLDVSVLGGDDFKGSHSNGLRDQYCALQWIKENIAQFGGDPENMTVMGESAGSIDISWLLTNGLLNGIAKRVVMMSGIAGLIGLSGDLEHGFSEEFAKNQAKMFLNKMDISTFEHLQSLDTAEIMDRVSTVAANSDMLLVMDSQFWPRVTPDFTPLDPFRAAAKYGSHGIDVIIGYTAYEMGLWLFWDDMLDQHSYEWSARNLKYNDTENILEKSYAAYHEAFPSEGDGVLGMNLIGDSIFVMPSYWLADLLSDKGETVCMFQFDKQSDERYKALHAADQAYFFGKLDTHAASHLLGTPISADEAVQRKKLSQTMMDRLLSFVKSSGLQSNQKTDSSIWPKYSRDNRYVMSFDDQSIVLTDPAAVRRQWWYETIYQPVFNIGNSEVV